MGRTYTPRHPVTPAQAGGQLSLSTVEQKLDSRLRRNHGGGQYDDADNSEDHHGR